MLAVQLSPLQLEGYFVREFSFAVRPGLEDTARLGMQPGLHVQAESLFNPDEITFNLRTGGTPNQEDPFRFAAVLELESTNPPERRVPYDVRVVLVGYFRLNVDQPVEYLAKVETAVRINATSILYSAARELIAGVTGRGLFPALILPSIVLVPEQKSPSAANAKVKGGDKKRAKKTTKKGVRKKKAV
jgi:preprotein translocase subunit SecB